MMNATIIDYGMGNVQSVRKAVERVGGTARITSNGDEIRTAEHLILPGVGYFSKAMQLLNRLDLIGPLTEAVNRHGIPILGICLGMQLFAAHSEEGDCPGLGWIEAEIVHFTPQDVTPYKIPHVGWNMITPAGDTFLLSGVKPEDSYYFVHSYYMNCHRQQDILATTDYGISFVSLVNRNNIYGAQFHPEKSHSAGLKIINNFLHIT